MSVLTNPPPPRGILAVHALADFQLGGKTIVTYEPAATGAAGSPATGTGTTGTTGTGTA